MPYWLMKSEPDELSICMLQDQARARWDGVRNYQARNYLREMREGDLFLFYHSSCPQPGIAGVGRLEGPAYADPTALQADSPYFDARAAAKGSNPWLARDVGWVETFERVLGLLAVPLVTRGERVDELCLVH